jgi:hypothetical protein
MMGGDGQATKDAGSDAALSASVPLAEVLPTQLVPRLQEEFEDFTTLLAMSVPEPDSEPLLAAFQELHTSLTSGLDDARNHVANLLDSQQRRFQEALERARWKLLQKCEELNVSRGAADTEKSRLSHRLGQALARSDRLQKGEEDHNAKVAKALENASHASRDLERAKESIKALEQALKKEERKRMGAEATIKTLETERSTLLARNAAMTDRLTAAEKQARAAQADVAELREEKAEAETELKKTRNEARGAKDELRLLKMEMWGMTEKLEAVEKTKKELEVSRGKIEALQKQVDELRAREAEERAGRETAESALEEERQRADAAEQAAEAFAERAAEAEGREAYVAARAEVQSLAMGTELGQMEAALAEQAAEAAVERAAREGAEAEADALEATLVEKEIAAQREAAAAAAERAAAAAERAAAERAAAEATAAVRAAAARAAEAAEWAAAELEEKWRKRWEEATTARRGAEQAAGREAEARAEMEAEMETLRGADEARKQAEATMQVLRDKVAELEAKLDQLEARSAPRKVGCEAGVQTARSRYEQEAVVAMEAHAKQLERTYRGRLTELKGMMALRDSQLQSTVALVHAAGGRMSRACTLLVNLHAHARRLELHYESTKPLSIPARKNGTLSPPRKASKPAPELQVGDGVHAARRARPEVSQHDNESVDAAARTPPGALGEGARKGWSQMGTVKLVLPPPSEMRLPPPRSWAVGSVGTADAAPAAAVPPLPTASGDEVVASLLNALALYDRVERGLGQAQGPEVEQGGDPASTQRRKPVPLHALSSGAPPSCHLPSDMRPVHELRSGPWPVSTPPAPLGQLMVDDGVMASDASGQPAAKLAGPKRSRSMPGLKPKLLQPRPPLPGVVVATGFGAGKGLTIGTDALDSPLEGRVGPWSTQAGSP